VIRYAVRGVKVVKIAFRVTNVNGYLLGRGVVGAINIGLEYLN